MLCPPCTTQKKLQLHLKISNTQNHQKIELYGSPTTKYLKKPHSSRRVPFLQHAMLLTQGVKAALPNTQKQTQGGSQTEEKRKYGPNERTEQNPRKRTK